MCRISLVTDIHVRIVNTSPYQEDWNYKRLMQLGYMLNKEDTSEVWILGDLFDRAMPSVFDVATVNTFLSIIGKPIKFIEGNHERINKLQYTMQLLSTTLNIERLSESFSIEGVHIVALGHDTLYKVLDVPKADILLSHFRWSHPIFGKGELSRKDESKISENFKLTILGDIHSRYIPKDNVKYIGSPYSISFSPSSEFGVGELILDNGKFIFNYVDTDLPNKIKLSTPLTLLSGVLSGLLPEHKYRITVTLIEKELDKFKKLKTESNVEIIGKVVERGTKEVQEGLTVRGDVKDILIDSLTLPKKSIQYIKDVLK